jgi:hypothetical protein
MAWQARTQGKRPEGRPPQSWKEWLQKIFKERGIEWKGERAIARDRERWKALCKPSAPTGRREVEIKMTYKRRSSIAPPILNHGTR